MPRGKFITIEGIEGAGKSTVMQYVRDLLIKAHKEVVVTREPGGTELAEEIRKVLLHTLSQETMQPITELLLMFAGRAQHINHIIKPALNAGKYVLSDRYIDASYAYQGGGRKVDRADIKALDDLVVDGLYPDLTLLLDLSPEVGFARADKRNAGRDRIEQEKIDFFERVRHAYQERAKADPARIKIIDASKSLPEVQDQIRHVMEAFIQ